jgi:hypothetical protein
MTLAAWAHVGVQVAKGQLRAGGATTQRRVHACDVALRRGLWESDAAVGVDDDDADVLAVISDCACPIGIDDDDDRDAGSVWPRVGPSAAAAAASTAAAPPGEVPWRGLVVAPASDADVASRGAPLWLGRLLWGMLSDGAAAAAVPADVATGVEGAPYVDPAGAVGDDAAHAAACRILRGLHVSRRERWTLDAAIATLEVVLFVLPALPDGSRGAREVELALRQLRLQAAAVGRRPERASVREALLVDFAQSSRARLPAVQAALAALLQ